MTDPISNAPGTVKRTDDDHTDDAIARMLEKPDKAMVVFEAMSGYDGEEYVLNWGMEESGFGCRYCGEYIQDYDATSLEPQSVAHKTDCPVTLARQLLARN